MNASFSLLKLSLLKSIWKNLDSIAIQARNDQESIFFEKSFLITKHRNVLPYLPHEKFKL